MSKWGLVLVGVIALALYLFSWSMGQMDVDPDRPSWTSTDAHHRGTFVCALTLGDSVVEFRGAPFRITSAWVEQDGHIIAYPLWPDRLIRRGSYSAIVVADAQAPHLENGTSWSLVFHDTTQPPRNVSQAMGSTQSTTEFVMPLGRDPSLCTPRKL